MMLWYLPLEPYRERYTLQLSAPITGWYERNWIKYKIPYIRIQPSVIPGPRDLNIGQVVDAIGRPYWCFSQVKNLLHLVQEGKVKDDDVIFLEDFWTPGFEALPYAFHLLGIKPKIYAYCWAQSVDIFDFTYPMRNWIRHFECGIGRILDGIFVASTILKELLVQAGIGHEDKVHVVGLPFDSEEVMERMPVWYQRRISKEDDKEGPINRKNQVVFSSRWDDEKNPSFFCSVAGNVLAKRKDVTFVICTSAPKLRSNHQAHLATLQEYMLMYPNNIILKENLTKEEYYAILCESKIQFNCADQDWVSFSLLEASVAGCFPLYPHFRSFPETLRYDNQYFYSHKNVSSAVGAILGVLNRDGLWTAEEIKNRNWIHKRFDLSWMQMARIMEVLPQPYDDYAELQLELYKE